MEHIRPWDVTVVRTHGLRLMRPEKSWRPIITLEVDKHSRHETVLGVDGQNPNLKEVFRFYDAQPASVLEMKVWHRSQSKRKGKKRNLVACAAHSLSELLKRMDSVEGDGKAKAKHLDIKLTCQSHTNRLQTPSSKGRPQNGALLVLKLCAPPQPRYEQPPILPEPEQKSQEDVQTESTQNAYSSDSGASSSNSSSHASNTFINVQPPSPITVPPPLSGLTNRRKRTTKKRLRGYSLFSNEDDYQLSNSSADDSSSSSQSSTSSALRQASGLDFFNFKSARTFEEAVRATPLDSCFDSFSDGEDDVIRLSVLQDGIISKSESDSSTTWAAGSLLPQHILDPSKPEEVPPYTERIEVTEPVDNILRWWERIVSSFTVYAELRDARMDSEFEGVFSRLRMEWTFIGTLLAGLAAVNTAVLSISPDSTIPLTELALRAIASSSIFTGLGIAATAYFILRYSFSTVQLFRTRALDIYSSYLFFSISARVPTLCMAASAVCLMSFLALVAFEVWPRGVVAVSFIVGIIMSLQFLVFGCHQFGRGVIGSGRRVVGVGRGVVRRFTTSQAVVVAPNSCNPSKQKMVPKAVGAA